MGRQTDFITILSLRHPFAYPFLGLLELVVVGRVNEVSALLDVSEACLEHM